MDGLKSLRGLLLVTELLFRPRLTVVPVRKPFWIPKLREVLPLDQRVGAGEEGAALRRGLVRPTQASGEHRVQVRNASGRRRRSRCAPTALEARVAGQGRARCVGAGRGAGAAHRSAGRAGRHAGGDAARETAGLRLQQRCVGQLRAVALDGDIQVVLQRQGDGVLQREIEVAGAQQRFQAGGIRQPDRRRLRRAIRRR